MKANLTFKEKVLCFLGFHDWEEGEGKRRGMSDEKIHHTANCTRCGVNYGRKYDAKKIAEFYKNNGEGLK